MSSIETSRRDESTAENTTISESVGSLINKEASFRFSFDATISSTFFKNIRHCLQLTEPGIDLSLRYFLTWPWLQKLDRSIDPKSTLWLCERTQTRPWFPFETKTLSARKIKETKTCVRSGNVSAERRSTRRPNRLYKSTIQTLAPESVLFSLNALLGTTFPFSFGRERYASRKVKRNGKKKREKEREKSENKKK